MWHSFWRRFLLCLVSKRQYHGGSEVQAVEDLAISLQLEDWAQVKELITKAPATPRLVRNFVSALALLQAVGLLARVLPTLRSLRLLLPRRARRASAGHGGPGHRRGLNPRVRL